MQRLFHIRVLCIVYSGYSIDLVDSGYNTSFAAGFSQKVYVDLHTHFLKEPLHPLYFVAILV